MSEYENELERTVADVVGELAPEGRPLVDSYFRFEDPEVQNQLIYGPEDGTVVNHAASLGRFSDMASWEDAPDWKQQLSQYVAGASGTADAENFLKIAELADQAEEEGYAGLLQQFVQQDLGYSDQTTQMLIQAFKDGEGTDRVRAMKKAMDEAEEGSVIQARQNRLATKIKGLPFGVGASAALEHFQDSYGEGSLPAGAYEMLQGTAGQPEGALRAIGQLEQTYRQREQLERQIESLNSALEGTIDDVVEA